MTPNKKEAIEFCINKYVTNKLVDICLVVILTFGLAVIIFPILLWFIYRYYKAMKEMNLLLEELNQNPENFRKVYANFGYAYTNDGDKLINSVEIYMNDKVYDIPQLYIWMSKYKSKERLAEILNE
jgi:hypothetical protein